MSHASEWKIDFNLRRKHSEKCFFRRTKFRIASEKWGMNAGIDSNAVESAILYWVGFWSWAQITSAAIAFPTDLVNFAMSPFSQLRALLFLCSHDWLNTENDVITLCLHSLCVYSLCVCVCVWLSMWPISFFPFSFHWHIKCVFILHPQWQLNWHNNMEQHAVWKPDI